jgi:hypothetical protein
MVPGDRLLEAMSKVQSALGVSDKDLDVSIQALMQTLLMKPEQTDSRPYKLMNLLVATNLLIGHSLGECNAMWQGCLFGYILRGMIEKEEAAL